jgi:MATE family multidrug resistance protein
LKTGVGGDGILHSARRILPLAWPVWVGQISLLAYGIVDTLLVARFSPSDLAALAVGASTYIALVVGFMGVLLALTPIVAPLYGAGRLEEAGRQVHQAVWLACALSLAGGLALAFPQPFLALSQVGPEVAGKVRAYVFAMALSLPATLLFAVYRGLCQAVARPRAPMLLQLGALVLKVPLSIALVFGVPALQLPALGLLGCGIATGVAVCCQCGAAFVVLRRDPFFAPLRLFGRGLDRPQRQMLGQQLRLGVPMGASMLVEVSGFTFMAIFIARLGTTAVAGHQLAMNLVNLLFMVPLALGNASMTLVGQALGARRPREARRLGLHGLAMGLMLALLLSAAVFFCRLPLLHLYTQDAAVVAAAWPLLGWIAVFHVADAAQAVSSFVLRAYKVAVVTLVVYVAALWLVGLGGGYLLAFNLTGTVPQALQGARGFWMAATVGLVMAGTTLTWLMLRVMADSVRWSADEGADARPAGSPQPVP